MKYFLLSASFLFTLAITAQNNQYEYIDVIIDGKPTKMKVKRIQRQEIEAETTSSNANTITKEVPKPDTTLNTATASTSSINTITKSTPTPISNTVEYQQPAIVNSSSINNLHIVLKGETLYSISKQYGISIAHIKSVNNLETNTISIGQELTIGYNETAGINSERFWTVEKGQTLYRIAKDNNMSVEQLKAFNGLQSNILSIGQKLRLQ